MHAHWQSNRAHAMNAAMAAIFVHMVSTLMTDGFLSLEIVLPRMGESLPCIEMGALCRRRIAIHEPAVVT